MSDLTVPAELLLFEIPKELLPGEDTLSKLVLSHQTVIDLVASSLVNATSGTYVISNTEYGDKNRSDIIYTPTLPESNFPPILIEIQKTVDQLFMSRLLTYSCNLFRHYKVYPVVLVFCVDNTVRNELDTFTPKVQKKYVLQAECRYWAKDCSILSKNSISNLLSNTGILERLVAIQHFFSSQQRSIMALLECNDPYIILLYKIAKEESEKWIKCDQAQLKALATITYASQKHLQKIKHMLEGVVPEDSKIVRHITQGEDYHSTLKRKYTRMLEGNSEDDELTPIEEPESVSHTIQGKSMMTTEEIKFIEEYKSRIGRMNWSACWQEGCVQGLFKKYGTAESLIANYAKVIKKKIF